MIKSKLDKVFAEMHRLNKIISDLHENEKPHTYDNGKTFHYCNGKYTAAVRRSSMDLTRALADLRRFGG